jgi:hypothetical protein
VRQVGDDDQGQRAYQAALFVFGNEQSLPRICLYRFEGRQVVVAGVLRDCPIESSSTSSISRGRSYFVATRMFTLVARDSKLAADLRLRLRLPLASPVAGGA